MALTKVNSILVDGAINTDSSGRVGIGTTTPVSGLEVKGTGSFPVLTLSDTSLAASATISCNDGDLTLTADSGGAVAGSAMLFNVDTTERMRIDSNGNLLLGSTANPPFAKFLIVQAASDPYARLARFETVNSGTIEAIQFIKNSGGLAQVGSITMTTSATAYNTSSDYRLKENVAPMTGALAKVSALKPVTYTWKESGEASQGFIAHELQEVVPECVTGEKDAVEEDGSIKAQGIDTSFLVATLTAAIQEQQAIITDLTTRLEALEVK